MDFLVGTTHHGRALVAEMHRSYRQERYWNPLKRYASRMVKVAMFLTMVACVATTAYLVACAFFIN
jgi:hypothetical protein